MAIKTKLPLLLLLLCIFLLSASLSLAYLNKEDENPYVFRQQQHFQSKIKGEGGNFKVLQRFSKTSNLLRGLENYRLAVGEANPNTFSIPRHCDADTVCVVLKGRGILTLIHENNKESHSFERGDIFRVRAGTTVYVVNNDDNEKLYVVSLINPVSNPGKFEAFFGAGGKDPESFYNAFSDDILQAAFNVPSTKIHRLFQGQNKGAFVKASREQIRALSRHASSSSEKIPWPLPLPPFGHESQGKLNLFNKRPLFSNDYGKLHQVDQDDFKQLQDLDVAVTFANITRGAMLGPYYNSRATKIALVVDGEGYVEMACPHMAKRQRSRQEQQGREGRQEEEQEQEQEGWQGHEQEHEGRQEEEQEGEQGTSTRYKKMSARVSQGDVWVVPAGHPIVVVASRKQNLQVVCFDINAEHNKKNPLAGKNNILKQLEKEAKELSFDIPAKQVDEILEKQDQSWFFPGPHQRQEEQGRAYA